MDQNSSVSKTTLEGVLKIKRPTFPDDRGFFRESVRIKEMEDALGYSFNVAQANHARSTKNTLRGIHAAPWNKLIYVPHGRVQAVIVDLREESTTFGKYESFIIGYDNLSSIFVPRGFGNSYLVLSDEADYTYLTDHEWSSNQEKSILWNDPDLSIKWEIEGEPVLSERDKQNSTVRTLFPNRS